MMREVHEVEILVGDTRKERAMGMRARWSQETGR